MFSLLKEAEDIMDKTEFNHVLWCGDFNWDPSRDTGFSGAVRSFIERIGLVSVWEKFPISYTHVHTDLASTSTLDHFMVSPALLGAVVDADALHLGCNMSRHSPI